VSIYFLCLDTKKVTKKDQVQAEALCHALGFSSKNLTSLNHLVGFVCAFMLFEL
jgi:hypothetical protein